MLSGRVPHRELTRLVLAAWVIHLPLLLMQAQPNDVFIAVANDGVRSCLIDRAMLDRVTQPDDGCCGAGNTVAAVSTGSDRCGSTLHNDPTPCRDEDPGCPKSDRCCVCIRLNDLPLSAVAAVVVEERRPLLGSMLPGDETADFRNVKPPLPPPQLC